MSIHWQSFSDFLAMGGYGLYVWGSFGATALILAAEPMFAMRRRRGLLRLARSEELRTSIASSPGTAIASLDAAK